MKVGFSLSACVADVAAGRVHPNDVAAIIAKTERDFTQESQREAWARVNTDTPEEREVFLRFVEEGRIVQPRLWLDKNAARLWLDDLSQRNGVWIELPTHDRPFAAVIPLEDL